VACAPPHAMTEQVTSRETVGLRMGRSYVPDCTIARLDPVHGPSSRAPAHPRSGAMRTTRRPTRRSSPSRESPRETSISPPQVRTNLVGGLYHFGRSVSDLARAFRLMGEGAYDRLHAPPPRSREPGPARATFLLTVPASQARRERLSSSAFPRASFSHSPTAPVGCTLPASLPRAALKAR